MDAEWFKHAVVYQIYPRSFADADGDGVGDLRGIIDHLDHVQALGADVIWLSPVFRSPMDDNGYDISDYQDIDPTFGTLADIDELIAGLHARGMKLVMDLVVNHTSDEHPWFAASRDKASDKRDWYIWAAPRPGVEPGTPGAEPTNWGSFFGGPAWTYDEASGEYYLHLFSVKQPDLNWENPEVRQAVYAMMRWWVDRGVDGFRMDVINLISKTYPLSDGPVEPGQALSYDVSLVTDGPRMLEFLDEMNAAVGLTDKHLFTVGEMVQVDPAHAREYTDAAKRRLNMVFTFEHMMIDVAPGIDKYARQKLSWPAFKKNLASWQEGLAGQGWNSLFWDNHDQPRAVSRFGDESPAFRVASAKTLATVLHLHKGTPFVYQGEELGMTNAHLTSIDQYRDIEALNYHAASTAGGVPEETVLAGLAFKGRDNARTPMSWSDAPQAGFTTGEPWIKVNDNYREINAAAQVHDPSSVFAHYAKLIELRHANAVVRDGRFNLLLPDDERLWVFTRTLGHDQLLVIANMTSHVVGVPMVELPDLSGARLVLTNLPDGADDVHTLHPWESRVYSLRA